MQEAMSEDSNKNDAPTTTEVSVNWEGLKRFLGWPGTIDELKKLELDHPVVAGEPERTASRK